MVAESWEISDGGTTLTFKLRDGVAFHKGYGPCTSEDVKFSLERVLDPETASKYRGQLTGLVKVEAPDPTTVRLTRIVMPAQFAFVVGAMFAAVQYAQGALDFDGKVYVSRGVDDLQQVVAPRRTRDGGRDGR